MANSVVVRTDYMGSHKGTLLAGVDLSAVPAQADELRDVGHKARRYLAFLASHLVCLARHQGRQVGDVTSDATTRYIKLKHEDQLRLGL